MSILFVIPTNALASSFKLTEADDEEKLLLEYIYVDKHGVPEFDKERAIEDELGQEIIEAGELFQRIVNVEMNIDDSRVQPNARIPVWGNWCGPEYGSGVPIDILDSICKEHDLCYSRRGYHKCSCDEAMQAAIRRNKHKMTGGQKVAANSMLAWLSIKVRNRNATGGILSCVW